MLVSLVPLTDTPEAQSRSDSKRLHLGKHCHNNNDNSTYLITLTITLPSSSFTWCGNAVPTSSFSHFHVPLNATSTATGLRIHNDSLQTSLNDVTAVYVSAMTATTTAKMTQVPATRSASTNAPKYQLDKCKATWTQHKTRSPAFCIPPRKQLTMQLQEISCCFSFKIIQQLWYQVFCCLAILNAQPLWL